jgi:hypothetical protein
VEKPTQGDRPDTRPRSARRPRDLVISLLVLLVPLLVLVGGYQLLAGRDRAVPVDQSAQIMAARNAGLEVTEPAGLGPAWVPVSATFRSDGAGATLRLGYVTPAGDPVQLVQSTVPAARLLAAELAEPAAPAGTVQVAGTTWHRYAGRPGETALVHQEPGRTMIVVGPAAGSELGELAASLR